MPVAKGLRPVCSFIYFYYSRWDDEDARVVCRQLNLHEGTAMTGGYYGSGNGRIILDNVECTGREERLEDCRSITEHNCNHDEDAGVICRCEYRTYSSDER